MHDFIQFYSKDINLNLTHQHSRMNKCEHGQKIAYFCVSEHCQSKEASGCEACIKKYHNHLTHSQHLTEEELHSLVKKFTLDNTIKPKCRQLQQCIYGYFNHIKTQISNSLDVTCKNIINQIGYPYLSTTTTLTTYKRIKGKEYRKVTQKQLKAFYEVAKIEEKELLKQENKTYFSEIKSSSQTINQLEGLIKNYQNAIKTYNSLFIHQIQPLLKVNEIIKSIPTQTIVKPQKKSIEVKEKDIVQKYNRETPKINIISNPINIDLLSINAKIDVKIEPRIPQAKSKFEKVQGDIEILINSPTTPPPKTQKSRDISLDRKIIKEHRFNPNEFLHQQQQKPRDVQKSESGLANQKIQSLKNELNNKEMEINEKKKLLIGIMKPNDKLDPSAKPKISQKKQYTSETRSVNDSKSSRSSQDLATLQACPKHQQSKNYAFTKLPIEQSKPKYSEQKQQVQKKLIIISTQINKAAHSKLEQVQSPLYRKRNEQPRIKEQSRQKYDLLYKRNQAESKSMSRQVQLKQNQQKSLALLLKSIHLNAQDAIVYLESSLKYADNNLSAVEYLSYLYLELNKPKECLSLCNKFLDRIDSSYEPQETTLNINNNRAAALNKLGRYSQAIFILERCLKFKEKDTLYKNLGDSYFSISIYEKAIVNYQKSVKLNSHNDQCYFNLAVCLYIQQSFQSSKQNLRKALQINPKNEQYLQLEYHIDMKIKSY